MTASTKKTSRIIKKPKKVKVKKPKDTKDTKVNKIKRKPNVFLNGHLKRKEYLYILNNLNSNQKYEFLLKEIPNKKLLESVIVDKQVLNDNKFNNSLLSKILGIKWKFYVKNSGKTKFKLEEPVDDNLDFKNDEDNLIDDSNISSITNNKLKNNNLQINDIMLNFKINQMVNALIIDSNLLDSEFLIGYLGLTDSFIPFNDNL